MNFKTFVATWPGRVVALLIIAALGGGAATVARANSPAPAVAPRTATVARGSITQTVSVSGSVNASAQARLAFKTGGKLAKVYVNTGQSVTPGQPLAELDTTDLQNALATAQQNLANAQASYQKQVQAASDTQASLLDAQKSTATSIANAQTALARLRTSYAAAKTNFTSLTNQSRSDAYALQGQVQSWVGTFSALQTDLSVVPNQTSDVRSATTSITAALSALNNANSYATGLMQTALNNFQDAQYTMLQIDAAYDSALNGSSDTNTVALQWQTEMPVYNAAASALSGAIDVVTAQIQTAQTQTLSAQNSVNTPNSLKDLNLDPIRATLGGLQIQFTTQIQVATAAKNRVTQANTYVTTLDQIVGGSLASAIQAVQTAQDQATTTLRNAQSAVANIPFNLQSASVSVQNAQTAVDTAKSNLDAAVLTAPTAGIVASIANQIGEFVSGGNTNSAFIVLTSTNTMVLHGTIGEADIAKLKLGQVANVTVDAVTAGKMTGKIISLDPVATISQGVPVYGVDIAIDVPADGVKAGMTGTANVILASKQNVLVVPNTAIRTVNGQRGVQVLKGGEIVDTPAQFGLANDTLTEVVNGLAEGDTVVIPQARASASGQAGQGGQRINIPGGFGR